MGGGYADGDCVYNDIGCEGNAVNRALQNRIMVANGEHGEAYEPDYKKGEGRYGGRHCWKPLKDGCMWAKSCWACPFPDCICHEYDWWAVKGEAERKGITFEEQKKYMLELKLANLIKV